MVRLVKPDRPRVRDYSSRREQWRLLLLIVPLGVVILLMVRLREPETADRVNSFFAPPDKKPRPVVAENGNTDGSQGAADPASYKSRGILPGVQHELLGAVKDNSYFRSAEKDAWFHLFEMLQSTPPDELNAARGIDAGYVQLVEQPHFYRGKLIAIHGRARQITSQTPAQNALGIESYYRVVIQPAEGGDWPIFVYCLELPAGLSEGNDLAHDVKTNGLFFKNLSYQWQDGLGIAPVIVANSIEKVDGSSVAESQDAARKPSSDDAWAEDDPKLAAEVEPVTEVPAGGANAFTQILNLAGWDRERLARFDDAQSLTDEQRLEALGLLRRLRSLDSPSLKEWSYYLPLNQELEETVEFRGDLVGLVGRVTKVTKLKPADADAERLEMPVYFECELTLDNLAGTATILTSRVPNDWLRADKLSEPISAAALYLKRMTNEDPPSTLWLAKEIAWHPGVPSRADPGWGKTADELFKNAPDKLFGKSILGALTMDVGRLDQVQRRGSIRAEERDVFYEMLAAVGHVNQKTLNRNAFENLPAVKQEWEGQAQAADSAPRKSLAQEVVRRAAEGRYSVAPLFNDPQHQIGRLFVFDGTARRVVRVEVGTTPEGRESDVARRFGFDHYYEMEVFTDDSQNYPLVFCVRELPAGFPTGGQMHVPVRVAGFFFKNWLYRTRGSAGEVDSAAGRPQYAPLLIGRSPTMLALNEHRPAVSNYVIGGLFVLALAGIWAAAAWYGRDDRRFRERTPAANFSLPPGQSLDELNVPAPDQPMSIQVESIPANPNS